MTQMAPQNISGKKSSLDMTNRERFQSFAEARTNKALAAIKSIGHLHNTQYYESTPQEVNKIFAALNEAIKEANSKFKNKKNGEFKL